LKLTEMLRGRQRDQEPERPNEVAVEEQEEDAPKGQWMESIKEVPTGEIKANPYQPRTEFEESGLGELAQSIQEHGVLHPVVVRQGKDGYDLIIGERRLRACRMLGWQTIPAVVRDLTDKAAAEMALIENLQRRDLGFFEEAEGYSNLLEEFGLTQEQLAERLGRSQSSIANKLRLLKLPDEVRTVISREMLSERHARALLQLDSEEEQLELVKEIASKKLNVQQSENLAKTRSKSKNTQQNKGRRKQSKSKQFQWFTTNMKKMTKRLEETGVEVEMSEDDKDDRYTVVVQIRKPGRGEKENGENHQHR